MKKTFTIDAYCVTKEGTEVGGGFIQTDTLGAVLPTILERITDALNANSVINIQFIDDPYYENCTSNMTITPKQ
jgi:hypothetical protein